MDESTGPCSRRTHDVMLAPKRPSPTVLKHAFDDLCPGVPTPDNRWFHYALTNVTTLASLTGETHHRVPSPVRNATTPTSQDDDVHASPTKKNALQAGRRPPRVAAERRDPTARHNDHRFTRWTPPRTTTTAWGSSNDAGPADAKLSESEAEGEQDQEQQEAVQRAVSDRPFWRCAPVHGSSFESLRREKERQYGTLSDDGKKASDEAGARHHPSDHHHPVATGQKRTGANGKPEHPPPFGEPRQKELSRNGPSFDVKGRGKILGLGTRLKRMLGKDHKSVPRAPACEGSTSDSDNNPADKKRLIGLPTRALFDYIASDFDTLHHDLSTTNYPHNNNNLTEHHYHHHHPYPFHESLGAPGHQPTYGEPFNADEEEEEFVPRPLSPTVYSRSPAPLAATAYTSPDSTTPFPLGSLDAATSSPSETTTPTTAAAMQPPSVYAMYNPVTGQIEYITSSGAVLTAVPQKHRSVPLLVVQPMPSGGYVAASGSSSSQPTIIQAPFVNSMMSTAKTKTKPQQHCHHAWFFNATCCFRRDSHSEEKSLEVSVSPTPPTLLRTPDTTFPKTHAWKPSTTTITDPSLAAVQQRDGVLSHPSDDVHSNGSEADCGAIPAEDPAVGPALLWKDGLNRRLECRRAFAERSTSEVMTRVRSFETQQPDDGDATSDDTTHPPSFRVPTTTTTTEQNHPNTRLVSPATGLYDMRSEWNGSVGVVRDAPPSSSRPPLGRESTAMSTLSSVSSTTHLLPMIRLKSAGSDNMDGVPPGQQNTKETGGKRFTEKPRFAVKNFFMSCCSPIPEQPTGADVVEPSPTLFSRTHSEDRVIPRKITRRVSTLQQPLPPRPFFSGRRHVSRERSSSLSWYERDKDNVVLER